MSEELFELHLKAHKIPFEREYRFHYRRRWRADFHIRPNILVEIEGGTWTGGRHNRPMGYQNDCEKYNAATLMGYRVLRYTPAMVKKGVAIEEVRQALAQ